VTFCRWVIFPEVLKDVSALKFRVKQTKSLKMKAIRHFETARNIHPKTQCNISEKMNLQVTPL